MTQNRAFCFLLLCTFFLTSAPFSHAAITVNVSDTSGSPVFNSLVTIIDESDTTRTFHSLTDRNGVCTINVTGVGITENAPVPFALGQNYPNPFNPSTVIPFTLSRDEEVKLIIFNALGQNIRTLVNGRMSAGSHTAVWDGTDDNGFGTGSGIYICELSSGRNRLSRKMLLLDGQRGNNAAGNSPRNGILLKPLAETYTIHIIGLDIETYEKRGNSLSDGAGYTFVVTRKADATNIVFPGAGVSGTPVSESQRTTSFRNITEKLNSIQGLPDSVHHKQLALFLAEQPEMEISGYNPGGAWGRFTDGRMVVFDGNVEAKDFAAMSGAAATKPSVPSLAAGTPRTAKATAPSWRDIPQTKHIGLYRSHEARSGWLTNIKLFVEEPVDENGNRIYSYTADTVSNNASVEAFMNLPDDLTVFALHAHGSDMALSRSLEFVYSVYTSTPVTPLNEIAYWNLLSTGQLVYYHPIKPANLTDVLTYTDQFYHYAFTASFVENYWAKMKKFGDAKTFVYFNTCSGMSPKARPIVDAIFRAGASLFAGWTYRSFGQDGPATASYIFDRLLGSNLHPDTMNDPHRPFAWDTLKEEMISLGYGKSYDDKYGKDKTGDDQYSRLVFEPAPGCPFKQLAPGITYLDVDEKPGTDEQAELTIYGTFGDTEGEVFIKKEGITASALSVKEWGREKITCYLQPDDYGDVSVKVNGNRSNLRPLSRWKGKLEFTAIPNPNIPDQLSCTLQDKVTWDTILRVDVSPCRMSKPEEKLSFRTVDFQPTKESTTTFSSSGAHVVKTDDGPVTISSWTGGGTLGTNDTREENISRLLYRLDANTKIAKMHIIFQGTIGSKVASYNNGLTTARQMIITGQPTLYGLFDEVSVPYYYIYWPFDDSWNILPGQKKITAPQYSGVLGPANAPVTIKWDKMTVVNPPLDDQYHGK